MADGIPNGITRDDVTQAIADFDAGAAHEFAPSTGYDLVFNGKHYPPKAIVGLAARRIAGRTLTPYDFKGCEGARCFRVLRDLGFEVAAKEGTMPGPIPFVVGQQYTRQDVYGLMDVPEDKRRGNWETGYTRWGNDLFMFPTVGSAATGGYDYDNGWEGDIFRWFAKEHTTLDQPQIQWILKEAERVFIFTRPAVRNPFTFEGLGTPISWEEQSPVLIRWQVDRNPSGNVFDKSYLLCWNPTRWEWPDFETVVQRSIKGEPIAEPWSTGNTKAISEGQRVYLYRQAIERGIIGSGWTTSDTYMDDHWDGSGKKIPYAKVVFDRIVAPEDVLPVEGLIRRFPNFNWNRLQSSGISLPSDVASRLEALWQEHLKGLGFRIEPNEVAMPALYVEGATRSVTVNAYERNPRARKACLDHYGFDCAVCVFNFANFYGDLGEGFIHVHHLKDLATVGGEYEVDPIADLRPVCPNCHAMLHAETPAMSIAKLRSIIDARRT